MAIGKVGMGVGRGLIACICVSGLSCIDGIEKCVWDVRLLGSGHDDGILERRDGVG